MRALTLIKPINANVKKYFYSTAQSTKLFDESQKSKYTTVDTKDVQHHSNLSEKWWDVKGTLGPLHSLNSIRVPLIRDGLANVGVIGEIPYLPLDKIKILDVGCGGGILAEALARIGANVTGIDASIELTKIATEHAALDPDLSERLQYINTSIEQHSECNPEKYDAVVASEILEHVADQNLFLKCCAVAIKPGGSLFITTLNKTTASWLGGIIAAEYILKLVPTGTHDWNKFISPNEIRRLIQPLGFQTKLIHGMCYNPIKNEWFWTSSTAINYALHAVKTKNKNEEQE